MKKELKIKIYISPALRSATPVSPIPAEVVGLEAGKANFLKTFFALF